jgi:hypothetical protein
VAIVDLGKSPKLVIKYSGIRPANRIVWKKEELLWRFLSWGHDFEQFRRILREQLSVLEGVQPARDLPHYPPHPLGVESLDDLAVWKDESGWSLFEFRKNTTTERNIPIPVILADKFSEE